MRCGIVAMAVASALLLFGCADKTNDIGTAGTVTAVTSVSDDITNYCVTERRVVDGTDHIYEAVCRILDKNGDVEREFVDYRGHEFDVYFAEENVIAVSNQAGTGIETRWYEFYDIENDVWSDTYGGHVDVKDGLICHQDGLRSITVERLFGDGTPLYTFDSFDLPMAENTVGTPVQQLEFTEGGIFVEYLSGEDRAPVTAELELNK